MPLYARRRDFVCFEKLMALDFTGSKSTQRIFPENSRCSLERVSPLASARASATILRIKNFEFRISNFELKKIRKRQLIVVVGCWTASTISPLQGSGQYL